MQMIGTRSTTSTPFPQHSLRDSPIKERETDLGEFFFEKLTKGTNRKTTAILQENRASTVDHFATGGFGPTINPARLEHVPVGFADPYRTDMFDSNKAETSELGQGLFTPTWADSTGPYNNDKEYSMLSVASTSAAPGTSRQCSCITCIDLGSRREYMWNVDNYHYRCRLSDCNFRATHEGGYRYDGSGEAAARKHEKDHFRHERQLRCNEDHCVYSAKRWSDLKRHYTSKHCLNPKTKFPCPEVGCKYGGDNGFTRKDKLKSHREKVHGKRADTEKCSRVSKSNAQGAA